MAEFSCPFWIVTQRRGLISQPVEPHGMPGFIAAFTTAEKAASFMVGRGETKWENKLVARSTLASLKEDLRRIGVRGVCLDPAEGECGTKIAFDELEKA